MVVVGARITQKLHHRKISKSSIRIFWISIGQYFLTLFWLTCKKLLQFLSRQPLQSLASLCVFLSHLVSWLDCSSLLATENPRLWLLSQYCTPELSGLSWILIAFYHSGLSLKSLPWICWNIKSHRQYNEYKWNNKN